MTQTDNSTPAAVVFDLDGTLADTAVDICDALNTALREQNLGTLEPGSVRLMIGKGPVVLVERALQHLGTDPQPQLVESLCRAFIRCYAKQGNQRSTLFAGVKRCLDRLAAQDIRTGVCSNKPHEFCQALLDDLGVSDYFAAVQGSADGLPRKPDPALLLAVLESLDVLPHQALYVGDSETDVRTARAAGVPVALVRYGYSAEPVEELGADCVLQTLQDLPGIWTAISPPDPQAGSQPPRSKAL